MAFDQASLVTYTPIPWDAAAASHLGRISGETEAGVAHYRDEVDAGRMNLVAIEVELQRVGSLTWMVDSDLCGDVLFVTGMGAEPVAGVSLARDACTVFLPALATQNNCRVIRFWTRREGFVKILETEGYEPIFVMEKTVA